MESQTLSNKLLRDFDNLYNSEADDYDVKIQVGENSKMENFKAHSVILRARSTYFRSAFSSNWAKKEGKYFIFKKPNVSAIVFQIILKYIYTGIIELNENNVKNNIIEILIAADEMNLCELVEYLQQHIINLNNDWIKKNIVKLFNKIYQCKGVFPKLEDYCNDINMCQESELLIDSNIFRGLNHGVLQRILLLILILEIGYLMSIMR
ncbi:BTB/POZ protein [Glomus cerebriforme]|uniref:BTB/POZ protein n=1 Tax=Glomus cerebriforme TaxID=658196 RepID=A0A397SPN4_9GLOM|nr:BTB/POZ protein [Glomus cerebriforme]